MDTFFEQIVSIRKTAKEIALFIGIWLAAIILCTVFFLFLYIGPISILIIVGIFYGTFKLSGMLNLEYEYIITNGTMDIDKITNKSSRKRILSFELSDVSRLEKFNSALLSSVNAKSIVFACNKDHPDAYLMVAEKEGKSPYYLVFAPDEKIKSAIVKYVPKFITNSAFK